MSIGRFWRTVRHLNFDQWRYRATRRGSNLIVGLAPNFWRRRLEYLCQKVPMADPTRLRLDAIADQVFVFQKAVYGERLQEMAAGRFTFLSETIDFGGIDRVDWKRDVNVNNGLLWRLNLGYMGYVVPWLASGKTVDLDRTSTLVCGLSDNNLWHMPGTFRDIWNPYTVSHRIINLLAGLNLFSRAGGDMSEAGIAAILDHCRCAAAYVSNNLERDLQFNHLMKNYIALSVYSAALERLPDQWLSLPGDIMKSVGQNFLADGGHAERSPMYHHLGLRDLRILLETGLIVGAVADTLKDCERRAELALRILSHPDGDIALFNDSWFGEAPSVAAIAPRRIIPGRHKLPYMGYVRLDGGEDVAIMDVGPCGPDENPAHAHADFLSVDLSVKGKRFLVDPGTATYTPGPARDTCRSAAQHNGPHVVDAEPIEFWHSFRVGRRGRAMPLDDLEGVAPLSAAGHQDGYAHLGIDVRRFVALWPGQALLVADLWRGNAAKDRAVSRFLVPADWRVGDQQSTLFILNNRSVHVNVSVGIPGVVQPAVWWPQFANAEPAHALSVAAVRLNGQDQHGLVTIFYWAECPDVDGLSLLSRLKDLH